jgi:hypothetical protein
LEKAKRAARMIFAAGWQSFRKLAMLFSRILGEWGKGDD